MYTNAADVIVVQPGASHLVQQLLVCILCCQQWWVNHKSKYQCKNKI